MDVAEAYQTVIPEDAQARMQHPRQPFSPAGRHEVGKLFDVETSTEGPLALTGHNRDHDISIGS